MAERKVEPAEVAQLVESYVDDAFRSAEKYDNVQLLGEGGVLSLHALAADIYQRGFVAGEAAERTRQDAARRRRRAESQGSETKGQE